MPQAFAQKRRGFQRSYEAAGLRFLPLELKHSFRSVQIVLDAVDLVFKTPGAFRGLDDPVATVHTAVRRNAPGLVEIWPLLEPEKTAAPEGWDAPFDTSSETSPRVALARRIAKCVGRLDRARHPGRRRRAAARHHARATFSFWCASAGRCSRPSSGR